MGPCQDLSAYYRGPTDLYRACGHHTEALRNPLPCPRPYPSNKAPCPHRGDLELGQEGSCMVSCNL